MGLGYLLHLQKGSTRKPHWVRRVNLYIYSPVVDTDLQIRGGGGGGGGGARATRPIGKKSGAPKQKKFLFPL